MKWFKHDTNSRNDTRLKLLKKRYGAEGYGVYFQLLEIVGENIKETNQQEWAFVEDIHTVETLAEESGVSPDRLGTMLRYMNEIGLVYKLDGKLCAPKILSRLDEYATKRKGDFVALERQNELLKMCRESVPTVSGECRGLEENRREQKRTEHIAPDKPSPVVKNDKWERVPLERATTVQRLVYHLEDTLRTRITEWGKQGEAWKMMNRAGYTEDQVLRAITYMATADSFYRDKPFDLMTVCKHIPRLKAEQEKRRTV